MVEKRNKGVASLVRTVGREAKRSQSKVDSSGAPKIFSILDYIEAPWGIGMSLFPAQRVIVKLYYNLPLDEKLPEEDHRQIKIRDMFGEKVLYTLTEREYLTYLYNEGRCNIGEQDHMRRELVLAVGRRSGKCVCHDSLVLTDKGVFQIGDLAEAHEDDFSSFDVGVVQEKSRRARSTHFYNGGVRPIFCVKSESGYSIKGTGNHRVRVMSKSGQVVWKYLDDIRPGDYLAINRTTDLWASDLVDLRPFHDVVGCEESSLPDLFDEKWGRFFGYLVGDGSWNYSENPETRERLGELYGTLFGLHSTCTGKGVENARCVRFDGVYQFLASLGWVAGCERHARTVPWAVLRSPRHVVCAFLRGLFETGGSVESGGKRITFSTASFRLVREVQTLLLNLGIVCSRRVRETGGYRAVLSVKGLRSRQRFAKFVGFDSKKKQDLLLEALECAQEGNPGTVVPHQHTRARDLLNSVPRLEGNKSCRRRHLRQALGSVIEPGSGGGSTYSRMYAVVEVAKEQGAGRREIAHFEELLHQDYFFDPVVSVEEGEDQVYDLVVPDGKSFVANGLTNHNTALSGIFASYEVYRLLNLYNPQEYFGLPNGNRIQLISIATDKDQAGLLFNEVTSHIAKCDYFAPYLASNTQGWVNFRTPYDIEKYGPNIRQEDGKFVSLNGKASLRVTFKSCIAKGLRGSGNIVIILDEVAHFLDKGGSSAKEIYEAVTPSKAAFSRKDPKTKRAWVDPDTGEVAPVESRVILISSPLGKSGKFYEKFQQAMGGGEGSENILAIQAPTWEVNPTVPSSAFREAYHADPHTYATEYGANFSDQSVGWIERQGDLLACVDPERRPLLRGRPRAPHQMGIDVGLVDDGTAVVITHIEDDKVVLDYHEIWYAGKDWRETNPHLGSNFTTDYAKTLSDVERLDFDAIADWISTLCSRFHITAGLFDRWNGIPLEQTLHKRGLKQFNAQFFTRDATSKLFQTTKLMMFDECLDFYDYPVPETGPEDERHSGLIRELFSLQSKQISKNVVVVEAPKRRGAHDDMSDALVRSIWLSVEAMLNSKHASRGRSSTNRLRTVSAMTPSRYQAIRSRRRGRGDRVAPTPRSFVRGGFRGT